MTDDVLAFDVDRANNAELIVDVARLGYLPDPVLDVTYGMGVFWKKYRPADFAAHEIDPAKAPDGPMDFTALDYPDDTFNTVVFDPPYKLNGTPTDAVDERYGVHVIRSWRDRHALINAGIVECVRVLRGGGYLLVKCQDQVCSGQVRWQTREFADTAESAGTRLVDRFDLLGGRAQPAGRRQVHARRNHSTLLVFVKGR